MDDLLFLPHRLPYPPDKGDKIRSYHLLRHLSRHYRVHLGTFVDDERDWQYVEAVKALCGETMFCPLHPLAARVRSLSGLLRGEALTLAYYRSRALLDWTTALSRRLGIGRFLVFSSAMAQFSVPPGAGGTQVIDFVDVDSDKWAQYARAAGWPLSMLYEREARLLLDYERGVARRFDASLFVSPAEAALFRRLAPESSERIGYLSNGVDTDYFSPQFGGHDPYPADTLPIVFTGAMDYRPNIDAVQWFADTILPAVRAHHPEAVFNIVGSKPDAQVLALGRREGVHVTGRVPDVRPFLAHARVAVAPLRIARGIQNKVLEAMAMAKPVVLSPQALEGIAATPGQDLLLASDAGDFARLVTQQLERPDDVLGHAARRLVLDQYGWSHHLARIDRCFDPSALAEPAWQP